MLSILNKSQSNLSGLSQTLGYAAARGTITANFANPQKETRVNLSSAVKLVNH